MTDKTRKPGLSRRQILKGSAAVAGLAAGSGAITGFPTIWAQNIKDVTIIHMGQSWSLFPAVAEQAMKDLGFKIETQIVDNTTQVNRLLTQPETFDITDVDITNTGDILRQQVALPIPLARYKWWDKVNPLFTQGKYKDGRVATTQGTEPYSVMYFTSAEGEAFATAPTDWLTSVPLVFNGDTLGIRPDLIGRKVESWAELMNPEFKGKTALCDIPTLGITDSALALEAMGEMTYVDKGNMTRAEIDATVDKLTELKHGGHFRAFWNSFEQSVQFMTSAEVVIQTMISPAVTEVRARGYDCEFVPLKEGYRAWGVTNVAMRHLQEDTLKMDAAIEYINWINSGWQGAFISRQGYYTAVPETAIPFMTADEYGYWYEGKPAAGDIVDPFGKVMEHAGRVRDGGSFDTRMSNIAMWNPLMEENNYLIRRWNDFLAA